MRRHAEPGESAAPGEPDPQQLVWAARVCYLEATWRESDCVALLYVAKKRAHRVGREWLDVLREYSAIHAHNARAAEIRTYPWGDVPNMTDGFNRHWLRLRELVSEFVAGKRRRVYALTDAGVARLQVRRAEWTAFSAVVSRMIAAIRSGAG